MQSEKFKDTATEEQLRVREISWNSIRQFMGQRKTPQLIDLILKTCRDALNCEYFVAYHDLPSETDLLLLVGKANESGLYTLESILISDMFQKEDKNV